MSRSSSRNNIPPGQGRPDVPNNVATPLVVGYHALMQSKALKRQMNQLRQQQHMAHYYATLPPGQSNPLNYQAALYPQAAFNQFSSIYNQQPPASYPHSRPGVTAPIVPPAARAPGAAQYNRMAQQAIAGLVVRAQDAKLPVPTVGHHGMHLEHTQFLDQTRAGLDTKLPARSVVPPVAVARARLAVPPPYAAVQRAVVSPAKAPHVQQPCSRLPRVAAGAHPQEAATPAGQPCAANGKRTELENTNMNAEYVIARYFSPLEAPGQAFTQLTKRFSQLKGGDAFVLYNFDLVVLKRRMSGSDPLNQLEKNVTKVYLATKPKPPQSIVHMISCHACQREFSLPNAQGTHANFCMNEKELFASFIKLKSHLVQCPNIPTQTKHIITSDMKVPNFQVIEILHDSDDEDHAGTTMPIGDEIYDDNMDAISGALQTRSMRLDGILGVDLWDLPVHNAAADTPFALFIFESLELVRFESNACPPEYKALLGRIDNPEQARYANMKQNYFMVCKCCRGRRRDGKFDPTAAAIVHESRKCAVDITTVAYSHLRHCLKGPELARMNHVMIDSKNEATKFNAFAMALHNRIEQMLRWIRNEATFPVVPAVPDTELWTSCPSKVIGGLIEEHMGIPCSNLTGPPKRTSAHGSAVLECWGFPRLGVLHGGIKPLAKGRVKRIPQGTKYARRSDPTRRPGSRVLQVETLPRLKLEDTVKLL